MEPPVRDCAVLAEVFAIPVRVLFFAACALPMASFSVLLVSYVVPGDASCAVPSSSRAVVTIYGSL